MSQYFQKTIQTKIQNWQNAKKTVQQWQASRQKVVFTNGCFDLIHFGHLYYLAAAKELGDKLIVALNSDASVQHLKGTTRPIKDAKNRLHLMASLQMVDLVLEFDEETPQKLIEWLSPNILVKGGDWKPEQIVGSDFVIQNGGAVHSLAFIEGYSTTKLEQKIIDAREKKSTK